MIHDARRLSSGGRLRADLVVVGSGPGGATAATIAAEAGLKVVVLEAGELIPPAQMTQREEEMLPRLFWQAGARMSADRGTRIHQGKGVGGSSIHNINLCKRIPEPLLEQWHVSRRLEALRPADWAALYDEVERLLSVSEVPEALWNRHNQLLRKGVESLGYRGGGLKHNRTGCLGSGFCELGCAYDAKNNAAKVFLPRLMAAGGTVVTHAQAVRVRVQRGRATGVEAAIVDGPAMGAIGTLTVEAPWVCLSGSATGTPALLLRSGVGDPADETGRRLRLHPAIVVAGDFDEPVRAWEGIPQTYECTELQDERPGRGVWIVPAFAHPMGVATMLPGVGPAHAGLMNRYAHMAVLTAMLHDETAGAVDPDGDLGLSIDYTLDRAQYDRLAESISTCAKLLFAAGARRVIVPTYDLVEYTAPGQVERLPRLAPDTVSLSSVHPMGSVPMGDDPARAAVDSRGRHHHVSGLYVADGSLFPTSTGGPPQLSIYALGLHVGRALVADARA